jgi:hypothetical protein
MEISRDEERRRRKPNNIIESNKTELNAFKKTFHAHIGEVFKGW